MKSQPANRTQEQLKSIFECYRDGRVIDAEKLARSIIRENPSNKDAWKALWAILKKTGKTKESLIAIQKAVQISPSDAKACYSLGYTLLELGELIKAEETFREAIDLNPNYAEAYHYFGVTIEKQGKLEEAETSYRKALALKPYYSKAYLNLGKTLKKLGRLDEAVACYRQAITLKPDSAEFQGNLGLILQELGRLEEAAACYRQAITLKPDFAEFHHILGITLKRLGRLDEAEACYRRAITLKPDITKFHDSLATTLKRMGRLEEAEASYRKAIALDPSYAQAHSNLGLILQELGRLDEAAACYKQTIALKPNNAEAHAILASMKKFGAKDEQYSKMLELYLDNNISDEQRCHINFGLAKAYDDLGNFEKAFTHYKEGNELRKKLLNYDINQDVELFRQIKFAYQQIEQNSLKSEKLSEDVTPIFIVGMPRSGTTIVEQIISSHSLVTGAGELPYAPQFGSAIAKGVSKVDRKVLLNFRQKYLEKIREHSCSKLLVTDKMPQNFRYIGLLAAAFPEAKIIHVKRNSAAVCWANYKQYFASKNLGYSYALDDVVSYHNLYVNLMEFWTNIVNKRVYNLDYELLTVSQERETRKLIDHLDLDWDEKCLSPQNNIRRVATASNLQVRRKLYQNSSQQWKKYQRFLNGAFDALL